MEFKPLVVLEQNTKIVVHKKGDPLPLSQKKEVSQVHLPKVKTGFSRPFPTFYEMNFKDVRDVKNIKVKLKSKETFTRYQQIPGQDKSEIFTTKEVYFIPLYFKTGRMLYKGEYNPNEKKAPDCQSINGIVPLEPKFAVKCEECEYSKWTGNKPPKCGEMPEILALDLTGSKVEDPELAKIVTKEAFTISFKKSAIQAVTALQRDLAQAVMFEDGSHGPIDMTQYVVKMTLTTPCDDNGEELTYCVPEFEIVGQIPFEVSEQLLDMLKTETSPGKTVIDLFLGDTTPHSSLKEEEETKEIKNASPLPVNEMKKEATEVTVDIEVKQQPEENSIKEEKVVEEPKQEKTTNKKLSSLGEDGSLVF